MEMLVEPWSGPCVMAGSCLTCSPEARTPGSRRSLLLRHRSKARFALQEAGRREEWSRRGEGMLCRSLLAKGQGVVGADELTKSMRKGILEKQISERKG